MVMHGFRYLFVSPVNIWRPRNRGRGSKNGTMPPSYRLAPYPCHPCPTSWPMPHTATPSRAGIRGSLLGLASQPRAECLLQGWLQAGTHTLKGSAALSGHTPAMEIMISCLTSCLCLRQHARAAFRSAMLQGTPCFHRFAMAKCSLRYAITPSLRSLPRDIRCLRLDRERLRTKAATT